MDQTCRNCGRLIRREVGYGWTHPLVLPTDPQCGSPAPPQAVIDEAARQLRAALAASLEGIDAVSPEWQARAAEYARAWDRLADLDPQHPDLVASLREAKARLAAHYGD